MGMLAGRPASIKFPVLAFAGCPASIKFSVLAFAGHPANLKFPVLTVADFRRHTTDFILTSNSR